MDYKKILVVDTSTSAGNIGIFENRKIVGEIHLDIERTHSERILECTHWLLQTTNIKLEEIELFISGIGPGSFTGIRIGLSLLKGFSVICNKPLAGVSSLDALAMEFKGEGEFIAFIEGRANEIFYAFYKKEKKSIKRISSFLSGKMSDIEYHQVVGLENCGLFAHNFLYAFFEINNEKISENITPLYVKKSDAEIKFGRV